MSLMHTTFCGQKESEGGLKMRWSPAVEIKVWRERIMGEYAFKTLLHKNGVRAQII